MALKKLREGENKRYNMGLERIAQVRGWVWGEGDGPQTAAPMYCIYISNGLLWTYMESRAMSYLSVCLWATGHHFEPLCYEVEQMSKLEAPGP